MIEGFNGPALLLPGGFVLVAPASTGVISRSLAKIQELQRRDGLPPSPAFVQLAEVFVAAAGEVQTAAPGSSAVPQPRSLTRSAPSVRDGLLIDPVSAESASLLLGCKPRNVRDLCARGVFETAQRTRVGWEIERAEVTERAQKQPSAGRRNSGAYWAGVDTQARRGADPHGRVADFDRRMDSHS